jgi:hypothetical protein
MLQIKEVRVDAGWRDFHQVPHYIYQRDPHWIAPLESDIEKVFSPDSNKNLCTRQGQTLGTLQ